MFHEFTESKSQQMLLYWLVYNIKSYIIIQIYEILQVPDYNHIPFLAVPALDPPLIFVHCSRRDSWLEIVMHTFKFGKCRLTRLNQ